MTTPVTANLLTVYPLLLLLLAASRCGELLVWALAEGVAATTCILR